jgi:hypothetical protein
MFQPEGPVYENPSADKFAPPPAPSDSRSDDKRHRRLIRIVWLVGMYVAAHWLQLSLKKGGWVTAWVIAVFAYAVLTIVEQRIRKGEHDDKDPYSTPTNIMR